MAIFKQMAFMRWYVFSAIFISLIIGAIISFTSITESFIPSFNTSHTPSIKLKASDARWNKEGVACTAIFSSDATGAPFNGWGHIQTSGCSSISVLYPVGYLLNAIVVLAILALVGSLIKLLLFISKNIA